MYTSRTSFAKNGYAGEYVIDAARQHLPSDVQTFVARVRKVASQPLCVGFGISSAEQAKQVAQVADGVIIGSRIIQLMEADDTLKSVGNFIKEVRNAIDGPQQESS